MNCKFCDKDCLKAGRQKNRAQKWLCKGCRKYQQEAYQYQACRKETTASIAVLVCEGAGIRGIARVLTIATATVMKNIKAIAASITKPPIPLNRKAFELDELRTFIGTKSNQYWVAYALCSETKEVVDFVVGKRTKTTLKMITNTLLLSGVEIIKTDKLNIYQSLVPKERHESNAYNINHIERYNLTLRTHLKRLSRRTICYSKSRVMLEACLKIYFWSRKQA